MKTMGLLTLALFWSATPAIAAPETTAPDLSTSAEELTVTAPRPTLSTGTEDLQTPEQPLKTVLTRQALAARPGASLAEVLKTQAGVDLSQTGGSGAPLTASLRGMASQHLLVVVDGVALNDPTQPSGGADLTALPVDSIERIEIHRGPHPRWGSGAVAGVLEITTRAAGTVNTSRVDVTADSIPSTTLSAMTDRGNTDRGVRLSVRTSATAGISAAAATAGNTERDGAQAVDANLQAHQKLGEKFELELKARHLRQRADGDVAGGVGGDDPNQNSSGVLTAIQAGVEGQITPSYRTGLTATALFADRTVTNPADPAHSWPDFTGRYTAKTYRADFNHKIKTSARNDLDFGVDASYTRADFADGTPFSGEQSTFGVYADNRLRLFNERLELREMARAEGADGFPPTVATRFTPTLWLAPQTLSLHASAGSGYKLPSFYQRFSADVGSPDLAKERVHALETGLTAHWNEGRSHAAAVAFRNDYLSMIEFNNATRHFENRRGQSWGLELRSDVALDSDWSLQTGYTYLRGFDAATGRPLVRWPQDKASVGVLTRVLVPVELGAEVVAVGDREDETPTGRVRLPAYGLINLSGQWKPARAWTVFGRISNLLDTDYQDIAGYGSPGITLTSGFSYVF